MSRCASQAARQPRYSALRLSKSREKLQQRLLFFLRVGEQGTAGTAGRIGKIGRMGKIGKIGKIGRIRNLGNLGKDYH